MTSTPPPRTLILGSDYTGETNSRMGVAEWLEGEITQVSLATAEKVASGSNEPDLQGHDLLIAGTGEDTTRLALDLASKIGNPLTVFVASILPDELDPDIHRYDLVVAPPHPQLLGDHVLPILGVPNRLPPNPTPPQPVSTAPRLALLLGGNTRYCTGFTVDYAQRLANRLLKQAQLWNGRFIVTNSRRTPEDALHALRNVLAPVEESFLDWEQSDPQGYMNLLEEAEVIFCTGDSLSMCSEASMQGKPLLVTCDEEAMEIYHLQTLHRMVREGHAHFFKEPVEDIPAPVSVLNTTETIGLKVSELLKSRKRANS